MQCPNCYRDNPGTNRFCMFCGTPLAPPGTGFRSEPGSRTDLVLPPLPTIADEVVRLRELVVIMGERLAVLERLQGTAGPMATPPFAGVTADTAGPAAVPTMKTRESPLPPPPLTRREAPPRKPIEWEQLLGGNWMTRIGVLTLVIGVAFFLKLAFDNQWSLPGVIVGIAAGLTLLLGGHHWRKPYPVFAQALSGGGLAYLYLSIYAALAIFHLISVYPALAAILMVSLLSARLALQQDSMALAILGILGAFSAPLILGYQAPLGSSDAATGQGLQIIGYVLIVDIGVLVLSSFRNWRWLTLLSLVGSFLSYALWYDKFGTVAPLVTAELGLTLIFLVFAGVSTLFHLVWRRSASSADYALMILNAAYYFGVSYALMWTPQRAWLGVFSLAMAFFYGGLACVASRRGVARLSHFATGIALVFLTVSIPVQMGDRAATTVAWAAEATVLMWLHLRLRLPRFQIYSYIAFALTGVRLLVVDTSVTGPVPVLNARVLAFLFSIAAMYLVAYLTWRDAKSHPLPAGARQMTYPVFLSAATFLSLWLIGAEVISYWNTTSSVNLTLVFFICMAGAATLHHLIWRRPLEIFDLVALSAGAIVYASLSAQLWASFRAGMGTTYLLLTAFYGLLTCFLLRRPQERAIYANVVIGIALAFFTAAVPTQFSGQVWTPIIWATEMAALVWLSFRLPLPQFRWYSYAVWVIMAGRLLLVDTTVATSAYTPLVNGRFLVFAVAIAATYFTAILLWRRRRESPDLGIPASTLFIAANAFSLWLLSFEVWDFLGRPLAGLTEGAAPVNTRNAQGLSLTALWAVYAVVLLIIGIARRWRQVRLWALGLLALPLLKLFVYDVFNLELLYRIISFACLGLLLLVGGYLYQRYGRSIRGLITKESTGGEPRQDADH